MPPINQDGATNDGLDDDFGAAEAFLRSLADDPGSNRVSDEDDEDKKRKTEEEQPEHQDDESDDETPEETPGDEDDADDEDGEDREEEEPKARTYVEDDNVFTKVKVGDEEEEVAIKDLKRLYGQEKALTQKSQAVADLRKKLDTQGATYLAQTNALLERAKERLKPYQQLDFLALSRDQNISNEELTALRQEAQKAAEDVVFLTTEANNFMAAVQQQRHSTIVETAKASIAELSDPKTGIKGFNEKMYDDIRSFAGKLGAPAEVVNNLVDAWAIRLIHKAMQFEKGAQAARSKTKVVNKGPKRVVKTTSSPSSNPGVQQTKAKQAMKTLRKTGTVDAAANAFLARMSDSDE
jgi:hypothetical protein